jgi:lanosterol synthase
MVGPRGEADRAWGRPMRIDERTVRGTLDRGSARLLSLQRPDGGWNEEMVWCPALAASWMIARHAVGRPADEADRRALLRHFDVTRREDGSWGLHPASPGYLYATLLCHTAQRLAGRHPDHPACRSAAAWIRSQGGPLFAPAWAKAWLALAGLYDWEGVPPMPPELFRIPEWLPLHPSHYYCHTRMIYLALSVLWAVRYAMPEDDAVRSLRAELYPDGWDRADFRAHRFTVAASDLYAAPGAELRAAYRALDAAERAVPSVIRRGSLARLAEEIRYEQRETGQQAVSPVSGLLNVVALHAIDPADPAVDAALEGMQGWIWRDDREGLRLAGSMSHAWDTAFAIQALAAHPEPRPFEEPLRRAGRALLSYRVAEDPPDRRKHWRSRNRGGWCFTDGHHRWPVSDCTAEAIEALHLAASVTGGVADPAVVAEAVDFMLSRQDGSGGFSSYEERRGPAMLERFNPSEMFDDCMIDRPYVECTASCLRGLRPAFEDLRFAACADRARTGFDRGLRFLLDRQLPDGSWPGAWGVCYTYGTFHALLGLRAAGVGIDRSAPRRAVAWLVARQRPDGGWGEDWTSCPEKRYVPAPEANPVQTAWAILALRAAGVPASERAIARGVGFLLDAQRPDGGWNEPQPTGVFMGTSLVHYRLYPTVFPIWALGAAGDLR